MVLTHTRHAQFSRPRRSGMSRSRQTTRQQQQKQHERAHPIASVDPTMKRIFDVSVYRAQAPHATLGPFA